MYKTNFEQSEDAYLLTVAEACKRYGFSNSKMREVANDAGAVIKLGKSYRIHRKRIEDYFDRL